MALINAMAYVPVCFFFPQFSFTEKGEKSDFEIGIKEARFQQPDLTLKTPDRHYRHH